MKKKLEVKTLLFVSVMPLIVLKTLMVFFGLRYSAMPGEGYGYGLAISIVLVILIFAHFVWRFRDYDDSER